MAMTNRDRVGKALELLRDGLAPFVKREMEREYGNQWFTQAGYSLRREKLTEQDIADAHALLVIMFLVPLRPLWFINRGTLPKAREDSCQMSYFFVF